MPIIHTKKICSVHPLQAYEIVKDFESYPEFLPWCRDARLKETSQETNQKEILIADLVIAYKMFSETLTTKVVCDPHQKQITISNVTGPFHHLNAFWSFSAVEEAEHSLVEFNIDFQVKSVLFQKILGSFFEEAMKKILDAFEKKFSHISGSSSQKVK